jgi:hypothetical protein
MPPQQIDLSNLTDEEKKILKIFSEYPKEVFKLSLILFYIDLLRKFKLKLKKDIQELETKQK